MTGRATPALLAALFTSLLLTAVPSALAQPAPDSRPADGESLPPEENLQPLLPTSSLPLFSGRLRNDAAVAEYDGGTFTNLLETRLVLQKKERLWSLYADGRAWVSHRPGIPTETTARLLRAFMRYNSGFGTFSAGQLYVNQGNSTLFNVFETDKNRNLTDLAYARNGFTAIEYELPLGTASGLKAYSGTGNQNSVEAFTSGGAYELESDPLRAGFSAYTNFRSFDFGLASNRLQSDVNSAGFYFKGDLVTGVQGSVAQHFNDHFEERFIEASLGLDYSFFGGDLVTDISAYYNEAGQTAAGLYMQRIDTFFSSRWYSYTSLLWLVDEFFSAGLGWLVNLVDYSSIVIPSLSYSLANGLMLNLQTGILTGQGNREFSADRAGQFYVLLRLEGRF